MPPAPTEFLPPPRTTLQDSPHWSIHPNLIHAKEINHPSPASHPRPPPMPHCLTPPGGFGTFWDIHESHPHPEVHVTIVDSNSESRRHHHLQWNLRLRRSAKPRSPALNFGFWDLGFIWDLGLGPWDFDFPSPGLSSITGRPPMPTRRDFLAGLAGLAAAGATGVSRSLLAAQAPGPLAN